jgi:hypothetical protein
VVDDPILFPIRCSRVRLGPAAIDGDRSMRLERDQRGDDVLDATALAKKVPTAIEDLRGRMGLGLVTSFMEQGRGSMRAWIV